MVEIHEPVLFISATFCDNAARPSAPWETVRLCQTRPVALDTKITPAVRTVHPSSIISLEMSGYDRQCLA